MNAVVDSRTVAYSDAVVLADKQANAVSWGAIFAGATAAASLSLILLMLGTGLGLSSVSPWAYEGVSAETFGVAAIVWTILTSIAASALGGYLAGRLRVRWLSVPVDEVHFRDTAHGLVSWGVATLATAALLTTTIGAIVGAGAKAGATVAAGAAATATAAVGTAADTPRGRNAIESTLGYYTDALLRRAPDGGRDVAAPPVATAAPLPSVAPAPATPAVEPSIATDATRTGDGRARGWGRGASSSFEVNRIFAHGLSNDALAPADADYLAQIVAERTGLTQQEARARVDATYAQAKQAAQQAEATAKQAADEARKAAAHAALWLFIALLCGAFSASFMGAVGGRQRDA